MSIRRILVYGVTGSGKSTLAREISERTSLPYISIDDLAWQPGWVLVSQEEQRRKIAEVCSGEAWVLDSAYAHCLDITLDRVDLIVGLDYPRWLSFGRLVRRTIHRIVTGQAVCNGNRESLRIALSRESILLWHFRSFAHKRRRMRQWAEEGRCIVLHRSPRDTKAWLDAIGGQIASQNLENSC